jgi:hypothetical protein
MRTRDHTLSSQSTAAPEGSERLRQPQQLRGERRVEAMVDGVASHGLRPDEVSREPMAIELRRALCAYLAALDERWAAHGVR